MKRKAGLWPSLILLTLVLAGCATAGAKTAQRGSGEAADAGASLAGKTWILAGYMAGTQFVPLEPGHATSAKIVFNRDGTLSGSTGINSFSGEWKLKRAIGRDTRAIEIKVSGITKAVPPNEIAALFDRDIIRELTEARALKKGKDSIQLLDGQNRILLRYVFSTAGNLY